MEYCFCIYPHPTPPPWCFCPRTFVLKNGLDNLQWTAFISDLHTKLRMIWRCVPNLAIASFRGVWDLGWTTCLMCPLLGSCFKFGTAERNFLFTIDLLLLFVCLYIPKALPVLISNKVLGCLTKSFAWLSNSICKYNCYLMRTTY